jgi:acetoin utilization deacetylase AcuC-like enzyme
VRPPGHHAESNKACGFCFLNNAGIAAMHAHVNYGIERVAVLDFDVHHGDSILIQYTIISISIQFNFDIVILTVF